MGLAGMGFVATTCPRSGGATYRRLETNTKNVNRGFELGMASYTFREFSLDETLAIHNHEPGDKLYPTSESGYERIKDLDPRMGLCLDIGHTQRSGIDPSEAAEKVADRILDIHLKDVTAASAEGAPIEIGRGVIDICRFLRTILDLNYVGMASFEYEKDPKDPLPGVAESLGYIKGLLSQMGG